MPDPRPALCVFCGSQPGGRPVYREVAEALGHELVSRGFDLVYGGGDVGLMGIVADTVLAAGGHVTGVIPEGLRVREVAHDGLTQLDVVDSMHTRKQRMCELASGFIALPGGLGTFEELLEILTWSQLGIHRKPVGILDVGGYFRPLLEMLDRGVQEGFVRPRHRDMLLVAQTPGEILDAFAAHRPPDVQAWLGAEES